MFLCIAVTLRFIIYLLVHPSAHSVYLSTFPLPISLSITIFSKPLMVSSMFKEISFLVRNSSRISKHTNLKPNKTHKFHESKGNGWSEEKVLFLPSLVKGGHLPKI